MFRILTENKNADAIKDFLACCGVDFTMFDCEGSWKGMCERSMLIEIDGAS